MVVSSGILFYKGKKCVDFINFVLNVNFETVRLKYMVLRLNYDDIM